MRRWGRRRRECGKAKTKRERAGGRRAEAKEEEEEEEEDDDEEEEEGGISLSGSTFTECSRPLADLLSLSPRGRRSFAEFSFLD